MKTVLSYRDGEAVPANPLRRAWPVWLLTSVLLPVETRGDASSPASFDARTLSQRGIDPQLASLLLSAPRFAAGRHAISLVVNGQRRGRLEVSFDQQGTLCFDQALLDAANLLDPGDNAACHDFLAQYPRSQVQPDPATLTVSLVVPTEALRPIPQDISGYQTGGFAGLLNYDLTGVHNRFGDDTSRFGSANTEVGFNAGDWIVRSRQVQTWQDGLSRSTHLEAYAQRTFAQHQAVLQAGQINLYNPVLSGAQINGVQVLTEQALQEQGQGATIDGIANSPAQVEVRQNGALIHSTVVPTGPFSLTDVRRLNTRSDVEVTIKESVGGERRFTVPAAMLGLGLPAPGYSVAAGRVRNIGDAKGEDPWVVSAGWTGAVHPQLTVGSGVLASDEYRSAGLSLGWLPWLDGQIQLSSQMSDASAPNKVRGLQTDISWSQRLNDQWSFSAANSWRTPGYRELEEATYEPESTQQRSSRYRDQQSVTLGWSHSWLGAFSAGVSRSGTFDGNSNSHALASWGTSIRGVSLSASAEWQMGGRQEQDNAVYLNVSVPLGESRRARSWLRNSGGDNRTGVGLNEQINDQFSYQVSAEHDSRDHQVETTLGLSTLPLYSQLDFSYSRSDAERSSYQGGARGGVVVHGGGVTLSPYPVRDTFALVSVSDMSGIKLSTPSGPVWTDWQGQAVVPQVSAYGRSPVEVQTRSLPRNADINNGLAMISVGRGAVERVDFGLTLTRRVLLTVRTEDGMPLPRGASISTDSGEFVTLVQDGGQVFLPNVLEQPKLWVSGPGMERCTLHYELPAKGDPEVYFETAPVQCTPS
ncbi:fimbria/pilus outer membrane usher protein [Pseudomonas fluorescens]|nr:fimbria/pilus outer membrane usher protein [Pseudomonas fluorescens]